MFARTGADPELTDLQPSVGIIGGALLMNPVIGFQTGAYALPVAGLSIGGAALLVSLI